MGCAYHAPLALFNYANLDREAISELSGPRADYAGLKTPDRKRKVTIGTVASR